MAVTPRHFFHHLFSSQARPTWGVLVLAAAAALLLVEGPAWRYSRHAITIVHEAGHALIGFLLGRKIGGIRLNLDTSGETLTSGGSWGIRLILTILAGYMSPALLGVGLSFPLAQGKVYLTLTLITVGLMILFLLIRNLWGFILLIFSIALLVAISQFAPPQLQEGFLALLVWFFTIGSLRPVIELYHHWRRGSAPDSDSAQLQAITYIPQAVWIFLFALVAVGAVGVTLAKFLKIL